MLENVDDIVVVGEAENGQELIEKYAELKPDVILVDISMPIIDGVEAIKTIKRSDNSIRALILSMYDSDEYVYYTMKSGAKGLISKNVMKGELLHAIRTVSNGSVYFGKSLSKNKFLELESKYREVICEGKISINEDFLNSKDRKILEHISMGMTSQEIADEFEVSKKTIDYYRSRIMQRLGIKSLPELMTYAVKYSLLTKFMDK